MPLIKVLNIHIYKDISLTMLLHLFGYGWMVLCEFHAGQILDAEKVYFPYSVP
jgi:hypothetical protein